MSEAGRLLEEERAALEDLEGAFALVPADRFDEPSVTPEGWSPKDVMFHVAYWLDDCAEVLEGILDGSFDPSVREVETPSFVDGVNREGLRRSRLLSPAEVRRGFSQARARAVETFGALPTIAPEAREWFEESGSLHYATHAADLRRWLEG